MSRDLGVEAQEVLKLLKDTVSRSILSLLSTGDYGVREIARILGRSESEVSRRLSRMRELGVVDCKWARIGGRNLKLYSLRVEELRVEFSSGGVRFSVKTRSGKEEVVGSSYERVVEIPSTLFFVGRRRELDKLASSRGVVVVIGVPGVGKTALVSRYAESYKDGPVYWSTLTELDYYEFLVRDLALFLARVGYSAPLRYVLSGEMHSSKLVEEVAEGVNRLKALIVFDDYFKVRDDRIRKFVVELAARVIDGKLVIVSRGPVEEVVSVARPSVLRLGGLEFSEAVELFRETGVRVSHRDIAEIYIATRGHPGLLALAVVEARERGLEEVLKLVSKGTVQKRFWELVADYTEPSERRLLLALSCFDEYLPLGFLEKITGGRVESQLESLYRKGLVDELDYAYRVIDLVKSLVESAGVKIDCSEYYERAGRMYLERGGIEGYFRALSYFAKAGCSSCLAEAMQKRITEVAYRILDYIDTYEVVLRELEGRFYSYDLLKLLNYELGIVYLNKGEAEEAYTRFKRVISMAEARDPFMYILAASKLLVLTEYGLPRVEEALAMARDAEKMLSRVDEKLRPEAEYDLYANLARINLRLGLRDKAYEAALREVEVSKRHWDPLYYAIAKVQLSIIKSFLGKPQDAIGELLEGYELLLSLDVKELAGRLASTISQLYSKIGDYESSAKYGEDALKLFELLHSIKSRCESIYTLITSYLVLGSLEKAEVLATDAVRSCSSYRVGGSVAGDSLYRFLHGIVELLKGEDIGVHVEREAVELLAREMGREAIYKIAEKVREKGYVDVADAIESVLRA